MTDVSDKSYTDDQNTLYVQQLIFF